MTSGSEKEPLENLPNDVYAFPLSFAQQRLWYLQQLDPASAAYNMPLAYRLNGLLNIAALEQSLNSVVQRHEILRTTFPLRAGEPVQVVHPASPVSLSITDLRSLQEREREETLERLLLEEARRPFAIDHGPLFRAGLIRTTDDEQIFHLNMHHIVSDEWSIRILLQELASYYAAHSQGTEASLAELPIQYADYSVWQRDWLQGENLVAQLSYWREQLSGISSVDLPIDRPRPAVQTYCGGKHAISISAEAYHQLKSLSRREGVTFFMTMLAAFQIFLHRYTGQDDVPVGTPIAGRTRYETEGLIGFFVNTLVLRPDITGEPTVKEFLSRVSRVAVEAYDHQELPFERLVQELNPERDLSRNPVFQILFALQNPSDSVFVLANLQVSRVSIPSEVAKFDLSATVMEDKDTLRISFNYNTDLFEAATIERMLGHFKTLLEGIAANPEQRLSELPLLTESERQQLLVEWNDTRREYPRDKCIHQLFEEQVEKTPDAIAVVFEDQQLSYRELNNRANQLAHYLHKLGVGPEVLVGICVERSLEMIVGLLGILKAGGAYVPLDPNYPKERFDFMLEDAQPRALLTQEKFLSRIDHERIVCLDRDWQEINRESVRNPESEQRAGNLAYVLYTSGSTGKPKGVMIQHRSLVNLFTALNECVYVCGSTPLRVSLNASITFDSSVKQIIQLLNGHALYIVPDQCRGDGRALFRFISEHKLDVFDCTPAQARLLIDAGLSECNEHLARIMLVGGEAIDQQLWTELSRAQRVRVFNVYGPTECTVDSTLCQIENEFEIPAIGRPIANVQVYILDRHMQLVPIGITGEIHVGGDSLARGYLNRRELTNEKFIANPFSTDPASRLYKTGDLARYSPDGKIQFLGRIDHQVKLRGYRIELGEIEAVLGQHPAIREAVVLAREDNPGDRRLVAYIVTAAASVPSANDLRSSMQQQLPEYMLPSAFVFLDTLPLTPNGKLDRKALPVPDQCRPELKNLYVPPRTPVETTIAEIWAEVLKLTQVGVHDNFFDLGGHSLVAVQVISRIQNFLHAEIPLRTLFENPTVATLAAQVAPIQTRNAASEEMMDTLADVESLSDEDAQRLLSAASGAVDDQS